MATDLITIKVTPDTRKMLRVLAAYSGKDMHVVAERAIGAIYALEQKRKENNLPIGRKESNAVKQKRGGRV